MSATRANPIRRHRFADEIVLAVRDRCRADNWHGPLEALEHWTWVVVWFAISWSAWRHASVVAGVVAYVLAVFFIGGRQRALAGLLHQACHATLMANRRAGVVVGTVFSGYPVLQSYSGYAASHVVGHHAHLGDIANDPDYVQYQQYGLCGEHLGTEALRRHLASLATPSATWSYIAYLVRNRMLPSLERPKERWIRSAFLIGAAGGIFAVGGARVLLLYWVVPLLTTQVWIGALAELLEHYPLLETAPRFDLEMSWNRDYSRLERFLLGEKAGEGYHLVHHLFPRVPLWRLGDVDRILRQDVEYAGLVRLTGIRGAVATISSSLPGRSP